MRKDTKIFLNRTAVFAILLVIVLFTINQIYINRILDNKIINKNFDQVQEELNTNKVKTVFFGDSHPARSVNPTFINNSVNFAVPGENYDETYYKIKWVIENHPEVHAFAIPLDPHSFSRYRDENFYDLSFWLKIMSAEELKKEKDINGVSLFVKSKVQIIGKGPEIIKFWKSEKTEMYKGWQRNEKIFLEDKNKNQTSTNRVNIQFEKKEVDPELENAFIRILDIISENKKEAIIITYPETKEYLEAIEQRSINWTKIQNNSIKKIKKYNNTIMLNYQEAIINQTYFSDSDHLNYMGAEILSKKINQDLEKQGK